MKKVLLIGNSGFLGAKIESELKKEGFETIGISSSLLQFQKQSLADYLSNLDIEVDIIVNAAGFYSKESESDAIAKCIEANVSLPMEIATFGAMRKLPIVALGSYFEKLSHNRDQVTYYTATKILGKSVVKTLYERELLKFCYLYIFDTYSESLHRDKFLDLLVKSKQQNYDMPASSGTQQINLTSSVDVARAVVHAVRLLPNLPNGLTEYQIKSGDTFTLKELNDLVSKHFPSESKVQWGEFPDQITATAEILNCAPDLPNYMFNTKLDHFLTELKRKS